jgi:plasmid stability protein
MATVQIKNIPNDVHRVLRRRAALAGQSLQEYMLAFLTDFARNPTLDEVFERLGRLSGSRIDARFAVDSIRADRDSR